MIAIREYVKVNNNMLTMKLPNCFDYDEVEVLIMPKIDKDDLSHLSNEIEIGINSDISNKSHEEIFADIKAKYAD